MEMPWILALRTSIRNNKIKFLSPGSYSRKDARAILTGILSQLKTVSKKSILNEAEIVKDFEDSFSGDVTALALYNFVLKILDGVKLG